MHILLVHDTRQIQPVETLENLTARAEKMKIGARHQEKKEVAFKVKKCFKCNKEHFAKDCRFKPNTNGRQIRCFRCNKTKEILQRKATIKERRKLQHM